jgi:Protein of unknown function (DUF3987)
VPQAAVSVCGSIQPGIFHRTLGIEHRESGLAARLLICCPPRIPKRWTEAEIDPEAEMELARLLDRLYDLLPTSDDEGQWRPVLIGLSAEAKAAFKMFYNSHNREQVDLSGELAAAWSKLEEYAARLALVIHCTRWAARDPTLEDANNVDGASMKAGITLAEWFKHETRRVYFLLAESEEQRQTRELVEWIERKAGTTTARELQQAIRRYPTADAAEKALLRLEQLGAGHWEPIPTTTRGGKPSRQFRLYAADDTHLNFRVERGFVGEDDEGDRRRRDDEPAEF